MLSEIIESHVPMISLWALEIRRVSIVSFEKKMGKIKVSAHT
jgi:hypothetical protein